MNKQERDFYNYLNSLPEMVFDQWLEYASQEELDLAERLFDEAKHGHLDKTEDLSLAKSVLKRFTLKG
jgi:hypothetical protein